MILAKKIGNAISAALFHKNPIKISDRSQIQWVIKMLQIFGKLIQKKS